MGFMQMDGHSGAAPATVGEQRSAHATERELGKARIDEGFEPSLASPETGLRLELGSQELSRRNSDCVRTSFRRFAAHGGSMGQESAESWTAQTLLQAGRFLWSMLLKPDKRRACVSGSCGIAHGAALLPLSFM